VSAGVRACARTTDAGCDATYRLIQKVLVGAKCGRRSLHATAQILFDHLSLHTHLESSHQAIK
jgi:hypothetical protein